MSNKITYSIELIPENAAKIDAVNRILLGDTYTESTSIQPALTDAEKMSANTVERNSGKTDTPTKTAESAMTLDQFKSAAKKAKRAHGEEFAMAVLTSAGVEVGSSLGRSMSKVTNDQYASIVASWVAGPQAKPEPEDEDGFGDDDEDGFGDDEDTSEVTVEAVKTALKAYAKSESREKASAIMKEHGATALSKVDDCTQEQLKAMFAKVVI